MFAYMKHWDSSPTLNIIYMQHSHQSQDRYFFLHELSMYVFKVRFRRDLELRLTIRWHIHITWQIISFPKWNKNNCSSNIDDLIPKISICSFSTEWDESTIGTMLIILLLFSFKIITLSNARQIYMKRNRQKKEY